MSKALKLLDDMINELTLLVEEPNIVVAPKTHSAPADNESNVNKELNVNKKEKKVATPTTNTSEPVDTVININSIDLRVGIIRKVTKHETAGIHITHVLTVYYTYPLYLYTDKLYCEEIDIGEEVPRQIASGLAKHYTLEQMQDRAVIVVANLKPRTLVGFKR